MIADEWKELTEFIETEKIPGFTSKKNAQEFAISIGWFPEFVLQVTGSKETLWYAARKEAQGYIFPSGWWKRANKHPSRKFIWVTKK